MLVYLDTVWVIFWKVKVAGQKFTVTGKRETSSTTAGMADRGHPASIYNHGRLNVAKVVCATTEYI